jgi:uncharacterized protein with HEPN domain
MYDKTLLVDKLEMVTDATKRIQRRFNGITSPEDFTASDENLDKLDGIAMMLIAIGEVFKKIDKMTGGTFLTQYPVIDWSGVKGIRDVLSHDYFYIDGEEIYGICNKDIPLLSETVKKMISDMQVK